MSNREKLKELINDIFLLDDNEFSFDMKKVDVVNWDSLGVVSVAVGVNQAFGYHFTPEEANSINGVQDIIKLLESKGIMFDE